jgi:hypothetical protein
VYEAFREDEFPLALNWIPEMHVKYWHPLRKGKSSSFKALYDHYYKA